MKKINVLDKSTINQIAAGEVIERPASVIKELVENSLDAGADSVSIEIRGGGIELIRITDNGSGIDRDDIRTAFVRHTTSKIKNAEDLSYITSLGFRGEALASIAAVADVELITKQKEDYTAIRYCIGGGEEQSFEEIGAPDGTTFLIRDIFKYVPVRRKFLKSSATEGSYCNEVVERIAISHPNVSIKYVNNGRNILFTNGSGRLKDIIFGVYGRDIASEIMEIDFTGNKNIHISGCICKPAVVRSNRNTENYFVNGRFIRSQIIYKAIEDAYQPYLMQHKYPFTALYIDIDPSYMDVNVHPSKQEVRFENPEAVYNAVFSAISDAFSDRALIHRAERPVEKAEKKEEAKASIPEPFEVRRRIDMGFAKPSPVREYENTPVPKKKPAMASEPETTLDSLTVREPDTLSGDRPLNIKYDEPEAAEVSVVMENEAEYVVKEFRQSSLFDIKTSDILKEAKKEPEVHIETKNEFRNVFTDYRIVGQIFGTYWIIESGNSVYMIDQHAAHEKILYEKFMKNVGNEEATQLLSPPIIVSLSSQEEDAAAKYGDELRKNGFVLEHFGGHEYALSEIPMNLYGIDARDMFLEILNELISDIKGNVIRSIKDKIATCACKAAVKGNTTLSEREAKELIKQLLEAENPFNCPHGRPVIIDVAKAEIEKKFKRIV